MKEASKLKRPERVVSLLGASTETIYRLGLGSKLVGRSHECDYPPICLSLPCISRPRLDVDASSVSIDTAVRDHSANGESVYKLDDAVLSSLNSDLIIAQDHCRVCAITPDDLATGDTENSCSNIPQLIVKPSSLEDVMDNIVTIAEGMGYPERGAALKHTLEMRMNRVREVVNELSPSSAQQPPRVALLEWCDPIMGCGYWLPQLVQVAGGKALHCPPPGGATPTISFHSLMESDPDVVIFALCGFSLTRSVKELVSSWGLEKLKIVSANRPVFVVDGNYLVNRSGPRVVESAEALAEAIHPNILGHFGHYGTDFLSTVDEAIAMMDAGTETGSVKIRPQFIPPTTTNNSIEIPKVIHKILPTQNPDQAVILQLQHLQNGEIQKAFMMNSHANQMRWCSPDRFAAVLKSHADFCRLLVANPIPIIGEVLQNESEGLASVRVTLPKLEDDPLSLPVDLLWTMVAERFVSDDKNQSMVWHTEKVGLL